MRLLVDTSAYSLFKRGHVGARHVLAGATSIGVTAVILGELLGGFAGGRRETDNRRELFAFLESPRVSILPMGLETAERFALTHRLLRDSGRNMPTNDLWIAASAMEHGFSVLTADDHFTWIPTLLVEVLTRET